jgi:uncharacterized membrane protein
MHRLHLALGLMLIVATVLLLAAQPALAAQPVVKVVFFYSPECQHCHKVITQDMPGITERFGKQLLVVYVDVSAAGGGELFNKALDTFKVAEDVRGVPAVVVGKDVLIGEADIPGKLPGIVEIGLKSGGIDWPAIPGVDTVAAQAESMATAEAGKTPGATSAAGTPVPGATAAVGTPAVGTPVVDVTSVPPVGVPTLPVVTSPEQTTSSANMTFGERMGRDRVAFSLALVVLVVMIVSVIVIAINLFSRGPTVATPTGWQARAIPVLAVIGLLVALYLAFVETTHSAAFCGPVGDCNTVQQSSYARLFGVLPVGVLGAVGYLVILGLWAWPRRGRGQVPAWFDWLLPLVTLFGVLFSIYLTYLELFVIGAICIWCVTSAIVMTILLWAAYLGWGSSKAAR